MKQTIWGPLRQPRPVLFLRRTVFRSGIPEQRQLERGKHRTALGGSEQLRNLQARLIRGDLLWRLREATMEAPEAQRRRLARVTLLLEEAAVL